MTEDMQEVKSRLHTSSLLSIQTKDWIWRAQGV